MFLITKGSIKPFYRMRDLILTLDVLFSYGIRLIVLGAFLRLAFFSTVRAPFLNESLVVLLIAASLLLNIEKQERARHSLRSFWIENINIGSAHTLRGHVLIGHLFLNQLQQTWDEGGVREVWEKICGATSWLERQAATYNVQVRITNQLVDNASISFDRPTPTHQNHFQFKQAFENALEPAMARLMAAVSSSEVKVDNCCLMVHVLELVRTYAVPTRVGMANAVTRGVEYCVCAAHAGSGSYAHEILHLFGADDFYAEFHKRLQNYRHEFLKGSIMFSCESLESVRVDELTAQNIGWL